MANVMRIINQLTAVGGVGLVGLSLWPGYAGGFFVCVTLPFVALLGLAWLVVVAQSLRASDARRSPATVRSLLLAPIVVCLTLGLLRYYIPRRAAFVVHKELFDQHIASAPAAGDGPAQFDRRLGIYHVDQYGADARGGVYFRTGRSVDRIGPDTMSHGFAYRPNPEGSPFGNAHYLFRPLHGGWYWFQASNDN